MPSKNNTIRTITIVYNIGNLLSRLSDEHAVRFCHRFNFERTANLYDTYYIQNYQNDNNNKQCVDDIA